MTKTALATAWEQPDLYGLPLLLLFLDTFQDTDDDGEDETTAITDWDPEMIQMSLQDLNIQLSLAAMSRLLVAINIFTSDKFRQDAETFIQFCNVLSGDTLANTAFDPADLDEISWGIVEANLISPPLKDEQKPYCDDVCAYVARVVKDNGLMSTPPMLQLAGPIERETLPGEFSDDPMMFSAIYTAEEQKAEELSKLIKDRLLVLLQQVEKLPLRHGDPGKAREYLSRLLA